MARRSACLLLAALLAVGAGAQRSHRATLEELEAKRLIPPGQHFYKKAAPLGAGAGAGGAAAASAGGGLLQLGAGAHRDAGEHLAVPKGFLHVYDLPPRFNEDIKELPTQWHPEQYDIDQVLHQHFLQSPIRARSAAAAKLFFIPVYLGRYFNFFWQQWSEEGDAWAITYDCRDMDAEPCWMEKWERAQNATSVLVKEAIDHVRMSYPHWNASEGADHFMVFSYDHARCDQAKALRAEDFGQLFSIQAFGSLTYRSDPKVGADGRGESYYWPGASTWSCYRPDVDVLVPVYSVYGLHEVVSPFATERGISMLMRFDYPLQDGKSLVLHHGHRIRKELIDYYEHNRLNGSDLGLRSTKQTEDDMRHSVFCVCPPGNTQDSARVWRAIILGCIPVTFFRANDLPFGRHMGMPYRDFVLNIQPDDYHQLNKRVRHLLNSPARLRRMQEALERYQKHFVWDLAGEGGVYGLVEKELVLRAQLLREMAPVARRSLAAHSRRRSLAAPGRRHSRDLLGQPERWDV